MTETLKIPEIDHLVRINRLLLFSSIFSYYLDEAKKNKLFKFGLKEKSKNLLVLFDDLLNNTYKKLKNKYGLELYNNFCDNYNSKFYEIFEKLEELELDTQDSIIFSSLILQNDLNNLKGHDIQDVPILSTHINSFIKELKGKNVPFFNTLEAIINRHEYYIKNKKLFNFYIESSNIKIN